MKKYRALLLVVAFIIVALSTHYALLASASNEKDVTFETLSGDERYLQDVVIEGTIDNGQNYRRVLLQEGKTVPIKDSTFERQPNFVYQQLIKNHKSFMRGKLLDANHFYEDEQQLIYVKEPDDIWRMSVGDDLPYLIEIFNKSDETVTSFTVNNKLVEKTQWITLESVQLVGNELKLVTNNVQKMGNESLHLLIIDLKTKQLKNDIVLEAIQSNDKINKSMGFYYEYKYLGAEKYLIFQVSDYEVRSNQEVPLARTFNVLDFTTNEVKELELPEQLFVDEYRIVVEGEQLIAASIIDGEVVVNRYNIGQNQWLAPITLEVAEKVFDRALFNLKALNNQLFILMQTTEGQLLTIVDVASGEPLYTGKITSASESQDYMLSLSGVHEKVE